MNNAGDGSTQLCSSEEPSNDAVCLGSCKADAPCRFMCICWFNQAIVLQILWDPGSIFAKNCSLINNKRIIILSHYGFLMIVLSICVQDSQSWLLNYLFVFKFWQKWFLHVTLLNKREQDDCNWKAFGK